MSKEAPDIQTKTLAETDTYMIWKAEEPDGEVTYHLELGTITLHFFQEEWDDLLALMKALPA